MLREKIEQVILKDNPNVNYLGRIVDQTLALVQQEIDKVRKNNPFASGVGVICHKEGFESACEEIKERIG